MKEPGIQKIIVAGSQDELVRSVGCLTQVYESSRHIKSAASPLYSRQDLESYAPPKGQFLSHLVTMGSGEMYGCLSGDCPVLLPDGSFKALSSIEPGDTVVSGHGSARRVNHVFEYDADEVIKVRVGGLPTDLLASVNHPFMATPASAWKCQRDRHQFCYPVSFGKKEICSRGAGCNKIASGFEVPEADYSRADKLRPGDRLVYRFPVVEAEDSTITPEEAFIMGVWLAEGSWVRNVSNKEVAGIQLSLHVDELQTTVPLLEQAAAAAGLRVRSNGPYDSDPNAIQVGVSGDPERIRQWSKWFGEGGAHDKRIPVWFHSLPRAVILSLLHGYYQGDGALTDPLQVQATTVSRNLAFGIQSLSWKAGVAATSCYYEAEGVLPGGKPHTFRGFRVNYALSGVPADAEVLLFGHPRPSLKQSRKTHILITDQEVHLPVREVTRLTWESKVYTLEVEGDHSYVSAGVWSKNSNRNFDWFPHEELLKHHGTFETDAYNYREHRNQDPRYAVGTVKSARYCPKLQRGEILMWTEIEKAAKEFERARRGEDQSGSMACRVKEDVCMACDFVSRHPAQRCDCISRNPGRYYPEKRAYALMWNVAPRFRDYSWVERPADRIAHSINYMMPQLKAASEGRELRGDELASAYGLGGAADLIHRIDRMIDIDGTDDLAKTAFVNHVARLSFGDELPDNVLRSMAAKDPGIVMHDLVKRAMVLPLASFASWTSGKDLRTSQVDPIVREASEKMAAIRIMIVRSARSNPEMALGLENLAGQFEPASYGCGCGDVVTEFFDKIKDRFSTRYEVLSKRATAHAGNGPSPLPRVLTDSKVSVDALALGWSYNAYLAKTAEHLDDNPDDWSLDATLASLR